MIVGLLLMAYLVGTIPFALWVGRMASGADLRRVGSGNMGTANVLRAAGPSMAALALALDVSKGTTAVFFAERLGASTGLAAAVAVAVVCGHVFPAWLEFRGGKGVATACGAFLSLAPWATLLALVVFTAVVWMTRYISLGSLAGALTLIVCSYAGGEPAVTVWAAVGVSGLIGYRHRSNIVRLYAGQERRLGERQVL
jgi:glycerol-3-phosphate acyltransferase PlsY